MLEFKKKTRAHKWRNYAVYGLLTLSQLSKTGYYHRLTLLARKKAIPFREIRDFFKKISPRPSRPRGLFRFFRYFYSSTSPILTWFSNPVLVNFLVSSSGISSVVIIFTISSNFAKSSLLKRFLQRASTVFT